MVSRGAGMFFDTHVHFTCRDGERGIDALVERARRAGVTRMVAVGGSAGMNALAVESARRHPGAVFAAIGYDRDQAEQVVGAGTGASVAALGAEVARLASEGVAVVAIGEIGLDFHYAAQTAEAQAELFEAQLALAASLGLPAIVHSRDAEDATLAALSRHAGRVGTTARAPGVLHCFTGTQRFADALASAGYAIGFSGIVSFRNAAALREVAARVPDDCLLIETDTPYLAPVPHRGKPNEPAFVRQVAEALAAVRGCAVDALAALTGRNAERLFGPARDDAGQLTPAG